jgi:hypothetical protein
MRKLALVAALGLAAVILVACTAGWIAALPLIAVVTGGVLFNFWLGGRRTDAGDIAGGRADERQAVIRLRAAELSGLGMVAVAVVAGLILQGDGRGWLFSVPVVVYVAVGLAEPRLRYRWPAR